MRKLYISLKDLSEELSKVPSKQEPKQLGPIAKLLGIVLVVVSAILLIPLVLFWVLIFILYIPFVGMDNWIVKKIKRNN